MSEKVIIFGTTVFSRDLFIVLRNEGINVVAYTVNEQYMQETELDGIPVVPFETIEDSYSPNEYAILNTLGYAKMNDVRECIFYQIKQKGYKNYTFISKRAVLDTDKIGEGSIIWPMAYLGPNVEIGKGNVINNCVSIGHQVKMGDFNFISGGVVFGGDVELKNKCFIGMTTTISNGVVAADKTFVAACSFLSISTEPNRGYKGIPATIMNKSAEDIIDRVLNYSK